MMAYRLLAHRSLVRSRLISPASIDASLIRSEQPQSIMVSWLAPAVPCIAAGFAFSSPLLGSVCPLGLWSVARMRARRRLQRARRRADRSVIDLADQIAQQLRAGNALGAAIESALAAAEPSLQGHLDPAHRARASGEDLAAALRRVDASGLVSLGLLASSLRLLLENGGPAALSIDRVGETLRAGVAARDEAAAQAGQAAASAALLAVLPFGFAIIVAVAEPAAAQFYFATWAGAGCVAVAGALSSISWWWIDQAVHR